MLVKIGLSTAKPEVTQEELGKITGLSQPNVSKRLSEKDKSCFSFIQLLAIADYFEVSLDSLIGRNLDKRTQQCRILYLPCLNWTKLILESI